MNRILIVAGLLDSGDIPNIINKNFIGIGHQSELFPIDENLSFFEKYLYKKGKRFSKAYLSFFCQRLYRKIKLFNPDILLIYGSNWAILPKMLGKLKGKLSLKIVLWEGNLQFWRWFQAEALEHYDVILANDSYIMPLLQGPAGHRKVIHMAFNMCDPDIHHPLDMNEVERKHYGSDIGFIGMGRPDRRKFFEELTEFNLKLWGKEWDKSEKLLPFFIDEPIGMEEKIKIYQCAKINVNIQSDLCQIDGISAKIFEIASCGGFFLTERKKDFSLFFDEDNDLVCYSSINELKAKIEYYLSNETERQRIAHKMHKKVIHDYTYKKKLQELLSKLED